MKTLILLTALTLAVSGKSLQSRSCTYREYQYKFSTVQLSWADAQTACASWNGTLATYENEPEKSQLAAMFDQSNNITNYWLDGTYPEGHTDLQQLGRNCSSIRQIESNPQRLKIIPKPCENMSKFICKKNGFVDKHNDIPMEYCPVQIKNHITHKFYPILGNPEDEMVYRVSTEYLNNTQAKQACVKWGGKIATIRGNSITQQKCFLESLLDHRSNYWIQPNQIDQTAAVKDWQKQCYIFDHVRRPTIKSWINWIDTQSVCSIYYRFICQKPATQQYTTPNLVRNLIVKQEGCYFHIKWDKPNSCDENNPILNYQIEIRQHQHKKKRQPFIKMPDCGLDSSKTSCKMPMDLLLTQEPYLFEVGCTIQVRAKACNANGCSHAYSDISMSRFPINRKPTMGALELVQKDRQLQLSWDKIPEVKYTLMHLNDQQNDFKKFLNTYNSKYNFIAERPSCRHDFKIQPQVGECFGETTAIVGVEIKTEPANMKSLYMEADEPNCSMNMQWVIPDDGCSPIRFFKFQMGTYNGPDKYNYQQMPAEICGDDPTSTKCSVKMPILLEMFDFVPGNPIAIQAKACNDIGCSKNWSQAKQASTIPFMKPPKITQLRNVLLPKVRQLWLEWNKEINMKDVTFEMVWLNKNKKLYENITNFQTGVLLPGTTQKFQVRGRNICGPGKYSDMLVEKMPTVPHKPIVAITTEKCQAKLSWSNFENGGLPITQYQSSVKWIGQEDSQYKPLECATDPQSLGCTIPMKVLVSEPHNLPLCSVMMPKISAKNMIGWGPYSQKQVETKYSYVFYKPKTMQSPMVNTTNDTAIAVTWQPLSHMDQGCSPYINYELQMNIGKADKPAVVADWKQVLLSETVNKTLANLEHCKNYRFRLRGINECSEKDDDFSKEEEIFLVSVPQQMQPIEVTARGGFLEFNWVIPYSCESEIQKFSLEIGLPDGSWIKLPLDCFEDPHLDYCKIKMPELSRPPYNLPECHPIRARISAKNDKGWSIPSIINTDTPQVYYRPSIVPRPTIRVFNLTTIQLTWQKAVSNCPPAPKYEIEWGHGYVQDPLLARNDKGGLEDDNELHKSIETDAETTTYNQTGGVHKCQNYKFKVRAKNDLGGEFGEAVEVFTVSEPRMVENFTMDSSGCQATFFWKPPNACQSKITNYVVEILAANGTFTRVTACGQQADQRSCSISMVELRKSFGLKQGEQIKVRIAAQNSIGLAQFTPPLFSKTDLVVKEPHKMTEPIITECTRHTNSFSFGWQQPKGVKTGGREILEYDVKWDEGAGLTKTDLVKQSDTNYTIDGLQSGSWYNFKVKARNVCDWGQYSDVSMMTTCQNETQWQFKLSTMQTTMEEAQHSCVQWGGNLASLETDLEQAQLRQFLDKQDENRYTVGLHSIVDHNGHHYWIHRAECNLWDSTANRIDYFEKDESQQQGQVCVELFRQKSKTLKTNPVGCFENRKFICQKLADKKVFRSSTVKLPASEAEAACLRWGGTLARIITPQEKEQVEQILDNTDLYYVSHATQKRQWVPSSAGDISVERNLQALAGPVQKKENECPQFQLQGLTGQIVITNDCKKPKKFICERIGNELNCPVQTKPECRPVITTQIAITAGLLMFTLMSGLGALTYFCMTKVPVERIVQPLLQEESQVIEEFTAELPLTPLLVASAYQEEGPVKEAPGKGQMGLKFPSLDGSASSKQAEIQNAGGYVIQKGEETQRGDLNSAMPYDAMVKEPEVAEPKVKKAEVKQAAAPPTSNFNFPIEPCVIQPGTSICTLHDHGAKSQLTVQTLTKSKSKAASISSPGIKSQTATVPSLNLKQSFQLNSQPDLLPAEVEILLKEESLVRPSTGHPMSRAATPGLQARVIPTPNQSDAVMKVGMILQASTPMIETPYQSALSRVESPVPVGNRMPDQPDTKQILKFTEEPALMPELVESPRPDDTPELKDDPPEQFASTCPTEPLSEQMPGACAFDHVPVQPAKIIGKRKLRKGLTKPSPLFCLKPELAMMKHQPRNCMLQFEDNPQFIHQGDSLFRGGEYGYDRTIVGFPQILMKPYKTLDRTEMNRSQSADRKLRFTISNTTLAQNLLRPQSSYGLMPDQNVKTRRTVNTGMRTRDPYTPNIKVAPSVRLQLHNFVGLGRANGNQRLMNKTIDTHTPRHKQRSPNLHTTLRHRLRSAANGRPLSRSPPQQAQILGSPKTMRQRMFSPQYYDAKAGSPPHHNKCLLTNIL